MEEFEKEEQKPMQNWNGEERRQNQQGEYKGDDRRKAAGMDEAPSGDLTRGNPGMSEKDQEDEEKK